MTYTPYDKDNAFCFAINFGDNDFYMTFMPIVEHLGKVKKTKLLNDKAFIVHAVNQLSPMYYVMYQNPFEYNGLQATTGETFMQDAEYKHIVKYLKIEERHVLIGDEVQKYIDECDGWCNHELFVNNHGKIYCV